MLRPGRAGDRARLVKLMGRVWGAGAAAHLDRGWEWQHEANPWVPPGGWYGYVLERGDDLVGFISGIWSALHVYGAAHRLIWATDLMVDSAWRGGQGRRLAAALASEGPLVAGFPVARTRGIWAALGTNVRGCRVRRHTAPLDLEATLARRGWPSMLAKGASRLWARVAHRSTRRGASTSGLEVLELADVPAELDLFWSRVSTAHAAIAVRDCAFLRWRFLDCPHHDHQIHAVRRSGELAGYLVERLALSEGGPVATVVDFLTARDDQQALEALLEQAFDNWRARRVERVECCLGAACGRLGAALRKMGFSFGHERTRLAYVTANQVLARRLRERSPWYVTAADSDLDFF
ncbi:MAG: hypothetical protein HYV63_14180 [Candidatus Schekmanbacteria bacterium]|nr:hypothetical protein [Candidatus Schekmanbacteria bacterium]